MFLGKLSEISFLRTINKKVTNKTYGLAPGVSVGTADDLVICNCSSIKFFENFEQYYFQKSIDKIYEKTTELIGVNINIIINPDFPEKKLGRIVKNINEFLKKENINIIKIDVNIAEIKDIIINFSCIGKNNESYSYNNIKSGMDIVMAGSAGLGAAVMLINSHAEKIREKFSQAFYDECLELKKMLDIRHIVNALDDEAAYIHTAGDGGIFSSIWELASPTKKGLEVDVNEIPIWQHVVEISEIFDMNPYLADGTGAVLIVTDKGDEFVDKLLSQNILAANIGKITDGHDRILKNHDETRYLEPPREDQIYKFI